MTPARWREIEDLYHEAVDLNAVERAALFDGTDPEICREVESLLVHLGPLPDLGFAPPEPGKAAGQLKPGDRLGSYRIEGALGVGGMAEVYRARDTQLDRDAAIKILPAALAHHPERLARFEREARLLASLNHPNIAQVYGIAEGVGSRGIAMELVPGEQISGPLPVETAISYARQIAGGLDAAHERGIVHRDLKPANIMVTPDGNIKLLDFGLARHHNPENTDPGDSPPPIASPTRVGTILGTVAYMSPEQARGKAVDKRADIWAFGVVLYELLTGRRLFAGETSTDILAAVMTQEPDLSAVPAGLRRLLRSCLEKDPRKRLRDIGDWERLIDHAVGDAETRPRSRNAVWMAVPGAAALGLIVLGAIGLREARPSVPAMHLTLPLPNTVATVGNLALSPDGRSLLLRVTDKDSARSGLALRSLDSDQFRLLPGTALARSPFWSPDGKRIAFLEPDNRLRTMSISGGPAEVVSDNAGCGCGTGTWGPNGVMIADTPQARLERCDAVKLRCNPLGGDPTIRRASPVFLPDGKHFLFTVPPTGPATAAARAGIYVASLDDPEGRRLLPDWSRALYAQDPAGRGFLIFRRDEALVGQAFDLKSLMLSGDIFRIADHVSRDSGFEMMASVAANGVLVYETGRDLDTELTWLDRAGKVLSAAGPVWDQHAVALSPAGDRILIAKGPVGTPAQGLWLRDAARDSESRLVAPPLGGAEGVWSPDGHTVAFAGFDGSLYRKDVSGGTKEEQLLKGGHPSDWSRDGRYLLFTEKGDIWVLPDPAGKTQPGKPYPFQHTDALESQGQFSPDGKWVAYTSNETGQNEVYVRPFPSGPGRWKISAGSGFEPRWRADGKELFYWAPGSAPLARMMAVPVKTHANGSFTAGEPRGLFEQGIYPISITSNFSTYSPAADGQRFLVLSKPNQQETIHVITNWTQMLREKL